MLLWAFAAFLVFAGSMILFYKPKAALQTANSKRGLAFGGGIGALAGYLGGLLGVGGGNSIIPVLVGSGMELKKGNKKRPQRHMPLGVCQRRED